MSVIHPDVSRKAFKPRKTKKQFLAEQLEELVPAARRNIRTSLREGNVGTSKWTIERMAEARGTRVDLGGGGKMLTFADATEASRDALVEALSGELSLEQLAMVQEAIKGHVQFAALEELQALRAEVEELRAERETTATASTRLPPGSAPRWGGFVQPADADIVDMTPINGTPAE